jgi:Putative lysophospholipase.
MIILYVALGVVAVCAAYFFFAALFTQKIAAQRPDYIDRNYDPSTPAEAFHLDGVTPFRVMSQESNVWWNQQPLERYEVMSHDGLRLVGHLLRADKPTRRVVLVLHGHQSASGEMGFIAHMFHKDLGLNVFMPDQRAHGKSEGNFYGMGYYEKYDVIRWLNAINTIFDDDCEIVLHGISMGAATVMLSAAERDIADNVVCGIEDCGFTRADQSVLAVLRSGFVALPFKRAIVAFANSLNKIRAGYSFAQSNCTEAVAHARVPLLFIHGTQDQTVPFCMLDTLYGACASKKEKLIIEGAAHGVAYFQDTGLYTKTVSDFIEKYFIVN